MDISKYRDSSQVTRVIALLRLLFGHTASGLAPAEIARELGVPASVVTVTLAQLIRAGAVEETHIAGRFRLGPLFVQGALMHEADLRQARTRLDELAQRYSRRND